jgi:hypothetical protein
MVENKESLSEEQKKIYEKIERVNNLDFGESMNVKGHKSGIEFTILRVFYGYIYIFNNSSVFVPNISSGLPIDTIINKLEHGEI